ncbi:MAG: AmmeMemoRadiSam system protein A [Ignavibacteriae bacterium]|nr:AmmeMemoRadiSam system protein A [Ignavibacteria bacterium]MBI3364336.1 AmmeMemoRadiSam system protein A [Ignavibacteriota bacterium]
MLSETDRELLLRAARSSVESAIRSGSPSLLTTDQPSLLMPCGAFVTLREGDELRGCIGYIEATKPLIQTVQEVASKAALEDIRFYRVEEEELPKIRIQISVLSSMVRIRHTDEIEVGKHGIVIEYGRCRGLLLPQVATENGWDREMFLVQVARKAGLPPMAWQDPDVKIFSFTAEIFGEN